MASTSSRPNQYAGLANDGAKLRNAPTVAAPTMPTTPATTTPGFTRATRSMCLSGYSSDFGAALSAELVSRSDRGAALAAVLGRRDLRPAFGAELGVRCKCRLA